MIFHFTDSAQFPGRVIPLLVSYSGYSLLYLTQIFFVIKVFLTNVVN